MTRNKYKILIVEDEANIRNLIATMLDTAGYQPISAHSLSSSQTLYSSYQPDLIILDLGLPDGDGLALLDIVRKDSLVPIIVLSARTGEADKVTALDKGANDYITKPFGSEELLARIRAALRNSRFSFSDERINNGKFVLKDLIMDNVSRRVFIKGNEIHLTQTEYNILALLCENCGKMMTYASIIKVIWGGNPQEGSVKKLQVNMANIRRKLGEKPGQNSYIANELGVGYRMDG